MKRAESAKEKIIRALLGIGAMNVSELSRATGVSRAVITREADLLAEDKHLVFDGHRFSANSKIKLVLLLVYKSSAELLTVNSEGVSESERVEYLDTFTLEDNISLAGRCLFEYAEYLRAEKYTVMTAVLFDGEKIPDVATLKAVDIKARRADVMAAVLDEIYPNSTVLCLDKTHLTSILCRRGEAVCEGGERNAIELLKAAAASLSLLCPDAVAFVGADCDDEYDEYDECEEYTEYERSAEYRFAEKLYNICEKRKIKMLYPESDMAREMLARVIVQGIKNKP